MGYYSWWRFSRSVGDSEANSLLNELVFSCTQQFKIQNSFPILMNSTWESGHNAQLHLNPKLKIIFPFSLHISKHWGLHACKEHLPWLLVATNNSFIEGFLRMAPQVVSATYHVWRELPERWKENLVYRHGLGIFEWMHRVKWMASAGQFSFTFACSDSVF